MNFTRNFWYVQLRTPNSVEKMYANVYFIAVKCTDMQNIVLLFFQMNNYENLLLLFNLQKRREDLILAMIMNVD